MSDQKPDQARPSTATTTAQGTDRGNEQGHTPARWFRATSASSIGIEIAVAVCVPTLLGRWADAKWPDFAPFGIVLGLLVGCGGAVRSVQRALKDYKRELQNPNDAQESLLVPGSLGSVLDRVAQSNGAPQDQDQARAQQKPDAHS